LQTRGRTHLLVDQAGRLGTSKMRRVRGLPVIDVNLYGPQGPIEVPMLVDTGGSMMVGLDGSLREQVQYLPLGQRQVQTMMGVMTTVIAHRKLQHVWSVTGDHHPAAESTGSKNDCCYTPTRTALDADSWCRCGTVQGRKLLDGVRQTGDASVRTGSLSVLIINEAQLFRGSSFEPLGSAYNWRKRAVEAWVLMFGWITLPTGSSRHRRYPGKKWTLCGPRHVFMKPMAIS